MFFQSIEKTEENINELGNELLSSIVNCDSENCIFNWKCSKANCSEYPHCEYIGMTSRTFRERMGEHHDYAKRDQLTEPSRELNKRGHSVSDLRGQVLEKVRSKDPFVLRARESMLIEICYIQTWP